MTWEQWFKDEPINIVRSKLKQFEVSLENDIMCTQNQIGSKYPDVLALADRLVSLKSMGIDLEHRITNFGTSLQMTLPLPIRENEGLEAYIFTRLINLLASIAQRSLLQSKYTITSRAIYLTSLLDISNHQDIVGTRLKSVHNDLSVILNELLLTSPQITREIYDACLILYHYTPSQFLQRVLDLRITAVRKLVEESVDQVFTLVDKTAYIHEQIVRDLGQARLSQRKLVDLPEFSDPLLSSLLHKVMDVTAATDGAAIKNAKAYPLECYSVHQEQIPEFKIFLNEVSQLLKQRADEIFGGISSDDMMSRFTAIMQQAQSALSAETSMEELLNSLYPAFSEQMLTHIRRACGLPHHELESNVGKLRVQIEQLSKLARQAVLFAPLIKTKLETLVGTCNHEINDLLKKRYHEEFSELTATDVLSQLSKASLRECATKLRILQDTNNVYEKLGGSPMRIPSEFYEAIAHSLLEVMNNKTDDESRTYWGDAQFTKVWEMLLVLDKEPVEYWEVEGIATIRKIVEPFSHLVDCDQNGESETSGGTSDAKVVMPETPSERSVSGLESQNLITTNSEKPSEGRIHHRSLLLLHPLYIS